MLYHNDPYFVLKDFEPYIETHELVEQAYRDRLTWLNMSVTNIAYSGKFSSDRTIKEYATDIWKINRNNKRARPLGVSSFCYIYDVSLTLFLVVVHLPRCGLLIKSLYSNTFKSL